MLVIGDNVVLHPGIYVDGSHSPDERGGDRYETHDRLPAAVDSPDIDQRLEDGEPEDDTERDESIFHIRVNHRTAPLW